MSLDFYERPTLVSLLANSKKSAQDFCFYQKRQKLKIIFSVCFAVSCYRGSAHPSRGTPSFFLGNNTQYPATMALNCICEHLQFILFCAPVSKMWPTVILNFTPFWLMKDFIETICFQISVGSCDTVLQYCLFSNEAAYLFFKNLNLFMANPPILPISLREIFRNKYFDSFSRM